MAQVGRQVDFTDLYEVRSVFTGRRVGSGLILISGFAAGGAIFHGLYT